jgi:hypothetical protein
MVGRTCRVSTALTYFPDREMGRTLGCIYGEQCELRINQYACDWEHDKIENYNVDKMLSTSANYWQVEQLVNFGGGSIAILESETNV